MSKKMVLGLVAIIAIVALCGGFTSGDAPGSTRDLVLVLWKLFTRGW